MKGKNFFVKEKRALSNFYLNLIGLQAPLGETVPNISKKWAESGGEKVGFNRKEQSRPFKILFLVGEKGKKRKRAKNSTFMGFLGGGFEVFLVPGILKFTKVFKKEVFVKNG